MEGHGTSGFIIPRFRQVEGLSTTAATTPTASAVVQVHLDHVSVGSLILWLERRKRIEDRTGKKRVYTTREKLDALKIMNTKYGGSAYSTASALDLAVPTVKKWCEAEDELKKQIQVERKNLPKLSQAQKEELAANKAKPKPRIEHVTTGKNRRFWVFDPPGRTVGRKKMRLDDLA